jgi:hypothetical protein
VPGSRRRSAGTARRSSRWRRRPCEDEPARFAATTPERLAALVVAFILGHAVQAVLDPDASDIEGVVVTLDALVPPGGVVSG